MDGLGFREEWLAENWEWEMRKRQSLETDLNRSRDFAGKRSRISVRRSMLLAINSAAGDGDPPAAFRLLVDGFLAIVAAK